MNKITIDLSSLVFIRLEGDGALFMDDEGDEIRFYASGTPEDRQAAVNEIMKAVRV